MKRLGIAPDRIGMIYNPVNVATLRPKVNEVEALRRSLALPESAFVYFMVGRMDAPKAHQIALRAFREVAPAQPDARLIMLGHGTLREALRRQAADMRLDDRVHFIKSAPRIAPYFAIADAFLFPSLLEGLPVAVLEGMCAGLPVVVSDIEPHIEVVEDGRNGLVVPRASAHAMAEAMTRLYAGPDLRRELGAAARSCAEARFATSVIVPQWERLFEDLAEGRRK